MDIKIRNNSYNKAFTLAEVLLTLTIIGIIASYTIPALIQNVQHMDSVVRVKKYQAVFSDALKRYALDNGCIGDYSQCNAFTGESDTAGHTQVWNAIKSSFNIVKDCGTSTGQGCFAKGVMYKYLNGEDYEVWDNTSYPKAILADGSSIRVFDYNGNCSSDRSHSNTGPLFYLCAYLAMDTNGDKGPNQVGRDVFWWYITRYGGILPAGIPDDSYAAYANGTSGCDPSGSSSSSPYPGRGFGCTAKVLKESVINY
ncbi:MAG: hypothetical protein ACD_20C00196G0013 [uncultured bacterium]|nr:MAG: hypothetical protein ACD_20C00196G0013 [uncultured bacterium]